MNELIQRQDAIDIVSKFCRGHDNDLLGVIIFRLARLPRSGPNREVIDRCLFELQKASPHTPAQHIVEMRHWTLELYEEIFGKGEKPIWWEEN